MPSFDDIEISEDDARPFERYVFQYGPAPEDIVGYTTALDEIDGSNPRATNRDPYKTTGKAERDQLNITLPASAEISRLVLPYPVPWQVEVTIYQGHFNADDQMVVWSGRVLSNSYNEKGEVVFTCESTLIQMKRRGPRRRWQLGCPLLLYGQGAGRCNADPDEFKIVTHVVAVGSDQAPSFPPDWNAPFQPHQFTHGIIKWTSQYGNEYRTIRKVDEDNNKIFFNGLLRDMPVGKEVTMYLGCNHLTTDCEGVFDNILNYGGDPTIPLENPVKNANFW